MSAPMRGLDRLERGARAAGLRVVLTVMLAVAALRGIWRELRRENLP
jgi:hypothetical protein